MQVNVEDLSPVKKLLRIEIPEEKVTKEINDAYSDLKKTAKVKGFRPGKAPRSVLERLYKKDVFADVSSKLIQDSFTDAIKETQLQIIGSPHIDPPDLEEKSAYKYEATVEINPQLGNIDAEGLVLKKNMYKIDEGDVEKQVQMIRRNLAEYPKIETERPVQEGDVVIVDYEGFKDQKPFEETQRTENFMMKIGDGRISKELDEQLVGANIGETKDIQVRFPEDYKNQNLANQTIDFKVFIREIREEKLPPVDDDLAKKLGQFETLEELKSTIRNNLSHGYEKRIQQELTEQILSALLERQDFEVPDAMVEMELEGIVADVEREFTYNNLSMDDLGITRESLNEKYRSLAVKQVKRHLILNKLIEQEDLQLTDEEIDEKIDEMAASVRQDANSLKEYYRVKPQEFDYFKHAMLEKKIIELIISKSEVIETQPETPQADEQTA